MAIITYACKLDELLFGKCGLSDQTILYTKDTVVHSGGKRTIISHNHEVFHTLSYKLNDKF